MVTQAIYELKYITAKILQSSFDQIKFRCGTAEVALEYLNTAIVLDSAEISPFIIRSQVFLRLGRTSDALKDAETAMTMERWVLGVTSLYEHYNYRGNPRALIAKGEALYATGNFEIALVYFERAGKLRQCQEIKEGTKKCREAILLTLGKQSDQGRCRQKKTKKYLNGNHPQ